MKLQYVQILHILQKMRKKISKVIKIIFRDIENELELRRGKFAYIYSHDVTLELEDDGKPIEIAYGSFIIRVQKDEEEGSKDLLLQIIHHGHIISEQSITSTIDSFRLALADMLDLYLALKEFFID